MHRNGNSLSSFPLSISSNTLLKIADSSKNNKLPLTPVPGTVIKLPSGKTALAHGSGIEKLKKHLHKEKSCKRIHSHSSAALPKFKQPAKIVTYTLDEIIEIYENSTQNY